MRHQSQASCTNHAPRELPHHELQEEALIKASVMYPNKPGVRFDHEYYRTKHLPLIKSRMGAALKYYTIDKGLADGEGKPLGPYVAMCHLLCDSVEEYQSSFGPHAQEIRKDIANFTDATSIHQISEVVVENSAKVGTAALRRGPIDRGSSPHRSDQVIR
jgi:uncharacterized protein (TIGR02118 family)